MLRPWSGTFEWRSQPILLPWLTVRCNLLTPTGHAQHIAGFLAFILSGRDQAPAQAWLPAHGFACCNVGWPGAVVAGGVFAAHAAQEPFCFARTAIRTSDSRIE